MSGRHVDLTAAVAGALFVANRAYAQAKDLARRPLYTAMALGAFFVTFQGYEWVSSRPGGPSWRESEIPFQTDSFFGRTLPRLETLAVSDGGVIEGTPVWAIAGLAAIELPDEVLNEYVSVVPWWLPFRASCSMAAESHRRWRLVRVSSLVLAASLLARELLTQVMKPMGKTYINER